MRVYFYAGTEKAARKKCNAFTKQLLKFNNEERAINVTVSCKKDFEASPEFPIPKAHRVHVYCEYSWMAK